MAWFRQWIMEGYSVRQLVLQNGHSRPWLYRLIDSWLAETPPYVALEHQTTRYLLFDGTFLHRPTSIVVLMDGQTNRVVRGQFDVQENTVLQLRAFFEPMIEEGLRPLSFTVDGNRQVIRASQGALAGCRHPALSGSYPATRLVMVSKLPEDCLRSSAAADLPSGHQNRHRRGSERLSQSRLRMGSQVRLRDKESHRNRSRIQRYKTRTQHAFRGPSRHVPLH